jgi:sulfite reductase (NADPH) flavoprotein alpha-component
MTLSIWRYSHWLLAIITSAFILVASITGAILAIEPISNQLKPYAVDAQGTMSIADLLASLERKYEEVIAVEVDENKFLKASVLTLEKGYKTIYINPTSGQALGSVKQRAPIYDFATNLHRSLFLKSTGRVIIGLVSFLMVLILITGAQLIAKRQGGFRRWFSKVVKEDVYQYYHVVLGRYMLIPILLIAITGVVLSMYRFELLPDVNPTVTEHNLDRDLENISLQNFEIFKNHNVNDLISLEYPFSEDETDYFTLILKDSEFNIHQYTGQIVKEHKKPMVSQVVNWSFIIHTGQGTMVWAVILLLSCIALLFFMFSGFAMTLTRIKKTERIKNKYHKDDSEYILLVGSETGTTFKFAKAFFEALINSGLTVFMDTMNNYTSYAKAKQLVIFAATYGDGDPPLGAIKFRNQLENHVQNQPLNYAVVGFGSLNYPKFCKFAVDTDQLLSEHTNLKRFLPVFKVHNQSIHSFKEWLQLWNTKAAKDLKLDTNQLLPKSKRQHTFKVLHKSSSNEDETFVIQLKAPKFKTWQSGDLLAITPKEDGVERLYSIAKLNQLLTLSVKRHEFGIVSNILSQAEVGNALKGTIKSNQHFHLPAKIKDVVMIANGTGIAPFLGMIKESTATQELHLMWGGRRRNSLDLYKAFLDEQKLKSLHLAFSRETNSSKYVQELLLENAILIAGVLKSGGVIMICGSVQMEKSVMKKLSLICEDQLTKPLDYFVNKRQILSDCY